MCRTVHSFRSQIIGTDYTTKRRFIWGAGRLEHLRELKVFFGIIRDYGLPVYDVTGLIVYVLLQVRDRDLYQTSLHPYTQFMYLIHKNCTTNNRKNHIEYISNKNLQLYVLLLLPEAVNVVDRLARSGSPIIGLRMLPLSEVCVID